MLWLGGGLPHRRHLKILLKLQILWLPASDRNRQAVPGNLRLSYPLLLKPLPNGWPGPIFCTSWCKLRRISSLSHHHSQCMSPKPSDYLLSISSGEGGKASIIGDPSSDSRS